MFIKIILYFLFICSSSIWAQGYREQFSVILKDIKSLTPIEYTGKILKKKKLIESLFEKKRGTCIGEYSEDIFSNKGDKLELEPKKISRQSKNMCFLELKKHLLLYYKALYQQRKAFLTYSHAIQLKKLETDFFSLSKSLQIEISSLESKSQKKGDRR
jgi:hypothetical protein